jgi:hypothetical protein
VCLKEVHELVLNKVKENNLIWKKSTLQLPSFCFCCFQAFRNLNAFFIFNLRKFNLVSIRIDKDHSFLVLLIPWAVIIITFLRRTLQYETQRQDSFGTQFPPSLDNGWSPHGYIN